MARCPSRGSRARHGIEDGAAGKREVLDQEARELERHSCRKGMTPPRIVLWVGGPQTRRLGQDPINIFVRDGPRSGRLPCKTLPDTLPSHDRELGADRDQSGGSMVSGISNQLPRRETLNELGRNGGQGRD